MFWKLFFNKAKPISTSWYRNAVVYQIYPWSFQDSNGDGIGDIQGIIDRLPYLNDGTPSSLGVGALWISPIYTSPMKDFGYDISDYCNIDPRFGTLQDFDRLIAEAHKRGIRIIMDLVINHTSSEHPWFKESRSSKESLKRDWYVWRDPQTDGSPPNNWLSVSGGPAWTFDQATGQYYLHHFLPEQPDLNWRNEWVRDAIADTIEFWLNRGVDGFRVDAMSHFIEDGLLRNDPANTQFKKEQDNEYDSFIHMFSTNRPQLQEIVHFLCDNITNRKNTFIVFETFLPIKEMVDMYRMHPDHHHAPFNFNFFRLEWSAPVYRTFVDAFEQALTPGDIPTYVFGNHDQPRLVSRFGEEKARLCAMLLLTLRGMPFIYYGEEIGMSNVDIPKNKIRDGFAHTSEHIGQSRDPARTPMQWDSTPHAGFTTGEPWLPLAADATEKNVSTETHNPQSLLNLYRALIWYRNNSVTLRQGTYRSVDVGNENIFAYIRGSSERILVLLNFSNTETVANIRPYTRTASTIALRTHSNSSNNIADTMILAPYEGIVIEL